MEKDGDRQKKMEGHCSTGQSSHRAVVPVEEEDYYPLLGSPILFLIHSNSSVYLLIQVTWWTNLSPTSVVSLPIFTPFQYVCHTAILSLFLFYLH
jgi:hypothetical protein